MYITYAEYTALYGESVEETDFPRLEYEARKRLDNETTGIDGIKKLKEYMPTDEGDLEAVRMTLCELIKQIYDVEQAENASSGYLTREDGTIMPKQVASVSSGSESISFASGTSGGLSKLVTDAVARESCYRGIITSGLEGIKDINGVNLLYMGYYPCIETQ